MYIPLYFTRWSIKSKIRSRLKSNESPFRLAEKLNWTHGFQRLAFLQLVVALHCGQCMERDRHVPRKNRVASRRVERSVFLSFFLPPPSVSSVAQFVVSSRFYESNKLYLAAGHGRWVMGVRRGRRSVFLSLSVCLSLLVSYVESRRKITVCFVSTTDAPFRRITRIPFYPRQLREWKYHDLNKRDAGYLFIFLALERSVDPRNDGTDGPLFWLELRRATCHGRIKRRFMLVSFLPSCNSCYESRATRWSED